jgi:TPR repeat protein
MTGRVRGIVLGAFVCFIALPCPADFQTAMDAYNAGDYETAYVEWLPLAESENAAAQFNIGLLFERGEGRAEDVDTAVEWYLRAAENGFGLAQFRLGELYEAGEPIEQDLVQARKWFTIAAQSRHPGANKHRKKVAKKMTPGEIALGDMWAREYHRGKKK